MTNLFISILNMSLVGSFVIAAICVARIFLKHSSKIFLYCLWAAAGFRLVFPFSIESIFSLIPFDTQLIPHIDGDISGGSLYAANLYSGISFQMWATIGLYVWLAGVVFMFLYDIASWVILKRKLKEAVNVEANIYETKIIKTPFVVGIFSPKIYLPAYLTTQEQNFIILHEQIHIKRRDYIIKFVAYLILCLHWFNPLVWLAFLLMTQDMEMSCDERVLKKLGGGTKVKKDYSRVLLSLVTKRYPMGGRALAFINGDIKSRVKNVLSLKKQSYIVFVISMVLVIMLSIGFAVDRVSISMADYDTSSEALDHLFFGISCCD